ncbi:hypothetical protein SS50377_26469 [Spironucleus salmonicida]|uniref:Uncharacterized protein n=1 Tax=Spironucleus salmonicida TaxID=348837 RepID=A0A9P8LQB3_9EUKA|nr:hypothetical protein SS50377_26469 [Spironucleus salmonicida]
MPKFPPQNKTLIDELHKQNIASMSKKIVNLKQSSQITKRASAAQSTNMVTSIDSSQEIIYEPMRKEPEIPFREFKVRRGRPIMTFSGNQQ